MKNTSTSKLPIRCPCTGKQLNSGIRLPHYTANPILSLNSGLYGQLVSGRTPENKTVKARWYLANGVARFLLIELYIVHQRSLDLLLQIIRLFSRRYSH